MQLTLGILAALVASALATPAITPAPRAADSKKCKKYTTTTEYLHHACPDICVEPGSPLCPKLFCPLIPTSCPAGSVLTEGPLPPTTSIVATTTVSCTVTVEAEVGCSLCGCVGCPGCVADS